MPLRITGMRLGVNVFTPHGSVRNGAIDAPEHCEYLKSIGYRLERCAGIPEPQPTKEEREAFAQIEKERKTLQSFIARGVSEMLSPLRKSTYRDTL